MKKTEIKNYSFFYRNGLTLVFITLTIFALIGQAYSGWREHNKELVEEHSQELSFSKYLTTGHFIEATFENWESEFLQMYLFVVLTVFLRQKGSSESKKLSGEEEVDREPNPTTKDAPWPVKKGGFILKLYKYSLSHALLLLFLVSFFFHFKGSLMDNNEELMRKGLNTQTAGEYLVGPRFWFESFQNYQSEFLSIIAIVLLSIYLRHKGSPQSKPVDAPNMETGD